MAALVARGFRNDEVARALALTAKTVEWHLTHIYRKLGVRSRTELAARLGTSRSFLFADRSAASGGNARESRPVPPKKRGAEDGVLRRSKAHTGSNPPAN